ncbi:MAG: J domain-containing protein [Leptolyngbyaceae cyanobacterium SM1_1_3]|nr:J domain-containing protein [Leptolyngbyaceae cyanobacterium SM1_1_3]NJN02454.1 J domain-containing protein [Leptolyngbyaceae cyanobacterium RM1_1_2]NJO10456.1 J domain-containing protein [Leptolyngbyaceae cyanobacterium SL_1_1]
MDSLSYYYKTLDLVPGCSKQDIKRAYRRLAQEWHPDKFLHDPKRLKIARENFESIKNAYEQLILHLESVPDSELKTNIFTRPVSAEEYYQSGANSLIQENYQEAVEYFTQAIRKKPDYLKAYQASSPPKRLCLVLLL